MQDTRSDLGIDLHHFSKKLVQSPGNKGGKSILLSGVGKKYYFHTDIEDVLKRYTL